MAKFSLSWTLFDKTTVNAVSPRWVLQEANRFLKEHQVREPEASSEWLLADSCGVSRPQLWLIETVSEKSLIKFIHQINLLVQKRIPVAYLLGLQNFMGLNLKVRPKATLIPRPETEELVELVIRKCHQEFLADSKISIVDVGAGSGCVILALRQALADHFLLRLFSTEVSPPALSVARFNDRVLRRQWQGKKKAPMISWRQGSLLKPLPLTFRPDIIVANLPYVRKRDYAALAPEIRQWEPKSALVAGQDGLLLIRRLIKESAKRLSSRGLLVLEIGQGQSKAVGDILKLHHFKKIEMLKDFNGIVRFVFARPRSQW